jgi:hypothetical protein
MAYARPSVRDYGALRDITEATGFFGAEDGGTKLLPNHHVTMLPSAPASP